MKKFFRIIPLLLVPALLFGCKGKPKQVETGFVRIYAVRLSPGDPRAYMDLQAVVDFNTPKGAKVDFTYRWYLNGKMVKEGKDNLLEKNLLIPGAEVYVEIRGSNGVQETEWISSEKARIAESEPSINGVEISPADPVLDQTLEAKVNCGNCDPSRFNYRWKVNGKILEEQDQSALSGPEAGLNVGDRVIAEISTNTTDPTDPLNWQSSPPVKILNRFPEFNEQGRTWLEGNNLFFQFRATDPDGDPISYQMVQGPPGARLEASAGMVRWTVPKDFSGEVQLKVRASDNHGGVNDLESSLQIQSRETPPENTP